MDTANLHKGTGRYDGLVHDGRGWIDPDTGERIKIGPWAHTGIVGRIVVFAVIGVGVFTLASITATVMGAL